MQQYVKAWRLLFDICQSMKITVWLGKTFQGFTKLNTISDYGKLSGDAFGGSYNNAFFGGSHNNTPLTDRIIIPF